MQYQQFRSKLPFSSFNKKCQIPRSKWYWRSHTGHHITISADADYGRLKLLHKSLFHWIQRRCWFSQLSYLIGIYAHMTEMHYSSRMFIFRFNLVLEDLKNFAQVHMKKRGANHFEKSNIVLQAFMRGFWFSNEDNIGSGTAVRFWNWFFSSGLVILEIVFLWGWVIESIRFWKWKHESVAISNCFHILHVGLACEDCKWCCRVFS